MVASVTHSEDAAVDKNPYLLFIAGVVLLVWERFGGMGQNGRRAATSIMCNDCQGRRRFDAIDAM